MLPRVLGLTLLFVWLPIGARAADDPSDTAGKPRLEIRLTPPPAARPLALPPLYATLAGLQIYDGYSTLHGVKSGASERNALVGGLAGQPAAFWAVKAGSTTFSIYLAERLWRANHRGQAITLMLVSNSVMAAVAAHNASVLKSR